MTDKPSRLRALGRLRPAGVIQVSICAALQAMLGVPIGFPVPCQIHLKRRR